MKKHYDYGVAGFWYGANYGSLLNGYAIYLTLKGLGKSVLMIHKPGDPAGDPELMGGHNVEFVTKYYDPEDVSGHYSYDRLCELNEVCDGFCAGSDQIWNYPISFEENMYLPFAAEGKRLISFASSFGNATGNVPPQAKERVEGYLRRFSAISVRERFAERLLREEYGIPAQTIIEPVFLQEGEVYRRMAAASRFQKDEPYLLIYILDPTEKKKKAICKYAKALGIGVVNLPDGKRYQIERLRENLAMHDFAETPEEVGCEEFLYAFRNAAFVITDSFHGTAFSVLFHKPFLSIGNPIRGVERFTDLLGRLELSDRLILDPDRIPFDKYYLRPFSYDRADRRIAEERDHAFRWLREAVR